MTPDYESDKFFFIGVSTQQSAVHRYFTKWCKLIGRSPELTGIDLSVSADSDSYQRVIRQIRDDLDYSGGLITTHKAAVFRTCRDLFEILSADSTALGEIGAIYRVSGKLAGDAPDYRSIAYPVSRLLAKPSWLAGKKQVVIFGAGGAGLALAVLLAQRGLADRITLTEKTASRLREVHQRLAKIGKERDICLLDATENDHLVGAASPGTIFVNASGLGKDIPGSPVNTLASIPQHSIVWDFNYRGDLEFLKQARQQTSKELTIVDGWEYFVSGWAHVICLVYGVVLDQTLFEKFVQTADADRRSQP